MKRFAGVCAAAVVMAFAATTPATAQFFLRHKDLRGERVTGTETGIGQVLPGATPAEQRAAVVWNMRAALNVAALQCQFEPSLLTVQNYNAILSDHRRELASSYDALTKYFLRSNKTKLLGQAALDQFGTRTYSGFATVSAQYNFCAVASSIGRDAVFAPRGKFSEVALDRTRELRNSLTPWGEQFFGSYRPPIATVPRLDRECWTRKAEFDVRRCGDPMTPYAYAAK